MNCQNFFSEPLDPVTLGVALQRKKDILLKSYDARDINYVPDNARFLAETEDEHLDVVFIESINDYNRDFSKSSITAYSPRYLYLSDFYIRYDFISKEKFRKSFNFMERYKFKELEIGAYNPKTNSKRLEKVYIAEVQAEELLSYTTNYGIVIEKEDKYLPIIDKPSFEMANEFLLDSYTYQVNKFLAKINKENKEGTSRNGSFSNGFQQPTEKTIDDILPDHPDSQAKPSLSLMAANQIRYEVDSSRYYDIEGINLNILGTKFYHPELGMYSLL